MPEALSKKANTKVEPKDYSFKGSVTIYWIDPKMGKKSRATFFKAVSRDPRLSPRPGIVVEAATGRCGVVPEFLLSWAKRLFPKNTTPIPSIQKCQKQWELSPLERHWSRMARTQRPFWPNMALTWRPSIKMNWLLRSYKVLGRWGRS